MGNIISYDALLARVSEGHWVAICPIRDSEIGVFIYQPKVEEKLVAHKVSQIERHVAMIGMCMKLHQVMESDNDNLR